MIRAIVFDMGGVMLQNKVEAVYQKLAELLNINLDALTKLQQQHKTDMLSGKMSAQDFADVLKDNFNLTVDVLKTWKEAYLAVMPINDELVELVEILKKTYPVALISNVPELHAQINKERGLFKYFDPALISCDVGLIKPQKEIFDLVLNKLGMDASDCIFIDDRLEHLNMPIEMGFQVIHYQTNEQLKESFRTLQIKF